MFLCLFLPCVRARARAYVRVRVKEEYNNYLINI